MVAMLAFGGTYAYFTATAGAKSGTATTGIVKLGTNSAATLVKTEVVSGEELVESGAVQVTNESNVDVWVFVTFTVELDTKDPEAVVNDVSATKELAKDGDYYLDYTTGDWELVTGKTNIYAKKVTATGAVEVCKSIKFYAWSESTETSTGSLMDATITVSIESSAIQATAEDGTLFNKDTAYAALVAGNSIVK